MEENIEGYVYFYRNSFLFLPAEWICIFKVVKNDYRTENLRFLKNI